MSFSIHKNITLSEWVKLQFRTEMINAFNYPWFVGLATTSATAPNLGQLNLTQQNLARTIHTQMKLIF